MKPVKKLLSAAPARVAPDKTADDGAYRILVFSDVHQRAGKGEKVTAFMAAALKKYDGKINMVVFTGDMMCQTACKTADSIRMAVQVILAPVKAAGVPFALVFGNHDYGDVPAETKAILSKTDILQMYIAEGAGLCVNSMATAYADKNGGITNFGYPIKNADGSTFAVLWFFDEGGNKPGAGGCRAVMRDQLAVFKAGQAAQNYPQTFVFQHIALAEVYSAMVKAPLFVQEWVTPKYGDQAYLKLAGLKMAGIMLEPPCPPCFSEGEYETLTEKGNVRAVFFGHDHVNDYIVRDKAAGFNMVNLPSAAWEIYGTFPLRGATRITLTNDAVSGRVCYAKERYTYVQARFAKGAGVQRTVANAQDFFRGVFLVPFTRVWNLLVTPIRYFLTKT
ncbi:MAG: metallophosphoesterase [Oscillospiraceae bacterium]|jgi:predicted phosphodiesterase|nr:metallophosphoesterase [Oscillospiraceae bacterium]